MNSIKRWLKIGSFGFAKPWLVCRAKPNVPIVRLAKNYNGIWLQVRWGIQRYLVCIKNLKIHKEKMIEKLLSPTCL
jgi:hypothetical protein